MSEEETCGQSVDKFMYLDKMVTVMVFNATFNNISVISWGSVLLLEETFGIGSCYSSYHTTMTVNNILIKCDTRLQCL